MATIKEIRYVATKDQVSMVMAGKIINIDSTHEAFHKILSALRRKTFDKIPALIHAVRGIEGVEIKNGVVLFNGKSINPALSDLIVDLHKKRLPFKFLIRFLERCEANPSEESRKDIFTFCQTNKIHITPTGNLLLFRVVTNDFRDKHTNRFDNSVGSTVTMRREDVDSNRNNTCSSGLHVCSFSYVSGFQRDDDNLVQVEVDPSDIVSVPTEYRAEKLRVCRFKVVRLLGKAGEVKAEDVDKAGVQNMTRAELLASLVKPNGSNRKLLHKAATARLQKLFNTTVTA